MWDRVAPDKQGIPNLVYHYIKIGEHYGGVFIMENYQWDTKKAVKMYKSGRYTQKEIATKLNTHQESISKYLRKHGIKPYKITDKSWINKATSMWGSGRYTLDEISERLNVHKDTIRYHLKKTNTKSPRSYTEWSIEKLSGLAKHKGSTLLSNHFTTSQDKYNFTCTECGRPIYVRIYDFEKGQTTCAICSKAESRGETRIRNFLEEKGIDFKQEYWFDDCKNPETDYPLRFDFYLPNRNLLIEYDGIQHFEPVEPWGGGENLNVIKSHDKLKNEYANCEKIELVRISYKQFDEIENILHQVI